MYGDVSTGHRGGQSTGKYQHHNDKLMCVEMASCIDVR